MKKINVVKFISIGGALTSFAVIFQAAPVFLPILGLILSPISTLPIALAALLNVSLGITVFFSSSLLLILISVQESLILFFTTGLLGIAIGTTLYRKNVFVSILFSTIVLYLGMTLLTYGLGIPAFGNITSSLSVPLNNLIFLLFSLVYATIWNIALQKFFSHLIKLKIINLS